MSEKFFVERPSIPAPRPFNEVHAELMANNAEYRASWLAEHRKGDDLGYLHHNFMENSEFYSAFESVNQKRKECLVQHLQEWRDSAGLPTTVIAERMGITAGSVQRIEKNPLICTINTLARYAHACGIKISLEQI